MQKNIKEIESCIPVNDDRLSIFDDSNEPILNTINNILKSNANKENITSDILKALEDYYTGPSVSEQIRQMRIAFENIIELPFHCNNNVLYDFDNELFEELSYCLKSSKKGGKGYFENFKQFERFLGVSQGSLHQVLFDKTYNFKKVNTKSYYKLIRFLSNYKNVEELNNDLLIASEQWNKKKSKIKSINSQTREEIFKTINKSNFLDKISNDIHSIICLHKNKFIYVEKNIMNDTSINKLTERTKMPLLLHVS